MDQRCLYELESKCIQEWAPECTSGCPIHVDVRGFIGFIKKGDWDNANKTIHRVMPLPEILGRICDAPCQNNCLRGQAGDVINIGALERACILHNTGYTKSFIPPLKNQRVAVLNSGLSSLTSAWDLIHKGYPVTIYEPGEKPGGLLLYLDNCFLPENVLESEINKLKDFDVVFKFNIDINSPIFIEQTVGAFDCVYLGFDGSLQPDWPLKRDSDDNIMVKPLIQNTSMDKVFAGGFKRINKSFSPVQAAAEGHWAANSITRYLTEVSLEANRENEGVYKTRLFTNLAGIQSLPEVPVTSRETGYNNNEAIAEADRCLSCECLECVKNCEFLKQFGSYPRKYIRQIYNNESITSVGIRNANKMINSCSLCGLCEQLCPENLAMQDVYLNARENMVDRKVMPPSAHEFALQDMEFSQSREFALARHAPGFDSSSHILFPGCQLAASQPEQVLVLYDYLRNNFALKTGLILNCCAAPAHWAGEKALFKKSIMELHRTWEEMGQPTIIPACSTCYRMFKDHLPDIHLLSLWEVLDKITRNSEKLAGIPDAIHVHDPCTARHEPDMQSSVRSLLNKKGIKVIELPLSGRLTECCGFGGLMQNANPELAGIVAKRRAAEGDLDYATYCAMCRDNLSKTGKQVVHLLDILFPLSGADYAGNRKTPTWSERRDNRTRLKTILLKNVWQQEPLEKMDNYRDIVLKIDPQLHELLDKRRILIEDIQQVIQHAEDTSNAFCNIQSGHFIASFKPRNATFWVEYSREADSYTIYNAYSHRMEVTG
jgi:glutamate synthase (NADPH) small chain